MSIRSKKNRLKKKFSGIETSLKEESVQNLTAISELESSPDNKSEITKELKSSAVHAKSNDISYLDFIIKVEKVFVRKLSTVYNVFNKYILKPISKDTIRVITFINKQFNKVRDENKAHKKLEVVEEHKTQKLNLDSVEAILAQPVNVRNIPEKVQFDDMKPEIHEDLIISRKDLNAFELDISQIFYGNEISITLTGNQENLDAAINTLEFDSTIYEYMAFKLDQTNLNQNINSINIETIVEDKSVTHKLIFNLKISGQKWTHLLSKNILSMLEKRISPYQGSIECSHIFNATTQKEFCSIMYKHQRLDIYTTKEQNDISVSNKNAEVSSKKTSEITI